jgi:hypothetical protein
LGIFKKKKKTKPKFCASFFYDKKLRNNFLHDEFGYILGDFFHNIVWSPWSQHTCVPILAPGWHKKELLQVNLDSP